MSENVTAPASAAREAGERVKARVYYWRHLADADYPTRRALCEACDLIDDLTAAPSPAPGGVDRAALCSAMVAYANAYCFAVATERRADNGLAAEDDVADAFAHAADRLEDALALVPFAPPADAQAVGE